MEPMYFFPTKKLLSVKKFSTPHAGSLINDSPGRGVEKTLERHG